MGMVTQEAYFRQRVLNHAAKHGVTAAAIRYHMSRKTVHKWKKRYDGTVESLQDLPRTPHHFPRQQTAAELKLVKRYANLWGFVWYMYSCWEYSVRITRSIALLCGYLGQYRTIRWQRRRCLFRHLLLADFSIYLQ